ncbi:ABC transporter substrate-binding protein [Natronoglomus mannanivorans]|uniref:ABC transporter substrate-binding protein n=1 Tax=Natronoglomus mannanivorans TaxID=2979990 RepID=A0AAP2Z2M5_9EURY|nr:ABC transporter substrate-binding protein [Halobacteria archaeon AArc-xg1-1]
MGVGGAAALAGCVGGDDGNGDGNGNGGNGNGGNGNGGNGGGDPEDQRLNYMRGGTHFPDLQWNWFGDNHNSSIKHYVDTIGGFTRSADNEQVPYGFEGWEYDGDSQVLTINLRDDVEFWNGDLYTAEDLWTFQEMLRLQNPSGSRFESIEIVDDTTLEFTTQDALNAQILYRVEPPYIWLEHGADVWQEWLEQYQDASDEDARTAVTEELREWEISTDRLVDEGLGTGAYIPVDVTDEYMDFEVHDNHWVFQGNDERFDPNIESVRMWYSDETGRSEQFVANERVDFVSSGVSSWEAFEDQLPDYWDRVVHSASTTIYKIIINWRNREYLQDVNFRRAMAAALDYENQAINTEQFQLETQTGMAPNFNRSYWGEEIPSDFIDYDVNSNLDLADEYLGRSGYTREDGSIYDEDGEELEEMRFFVGGSTWGDVAQSSAQELQQYGFPIDIRPVDRSTKLDIVQNEMGEWDMSTESHYAAGTNHPSDYFRPNSFWGWRIGPAGFGPAAEFHDQVEGWLADGETHSPYNGKPMVFDIPAEVGSEEITGDTKEINIYELHDEIRSPLSNERDQEIIRDLSWAWNYMVPDIDVVLWKNESFGNTQKIDFGETDDLGSYVDLRWPELGLARLNE